MINPGHRAGLFWAARKPKKKAQLETRHDLANLGRARPEARSRPGLFSLLDTRDGLSPKKKLETVESTRAESTSLSSLSQPAQFPDGPIPQWLPTPTRPPPLVPFLSQTSVARGESPIPIDLLARSSLLSHAGPPAPAQTPAKPSSRSRQGRRRCLLPLRQGRRRLFCKLTSAPSRATSPAAHPFSSLNSGVSSALPLHSGRRGPS
jgi:hypothetical protein